MPHFSVRGDRGDSPGHPSMFMMGAICDREGSRRRPREIRT